MKQLLGENQTRIAVVLLLLAVLVLGFYTLRILLVPLVIGALVIPCLIHHVA